MRACRFLEEDLQTHGEMLETLRVAVAERDQEMDRFQVPGLRRGPAFASSTPSLPSILQTRSTEDCELSERLAFFFRTSSASLISPWPIQDLQLRGKLCAPAGAPALAALASPARVAALAVPRGTD